jgi:hypothetical protein
MTLRQELVDMTLNTKVAAHGGSIVGNTRKEIEANIGKSIVSPLNARKIKQLPENGIEN